MNYKERLFATHPEWHDALDKDMLEARDLARQKIEQALFDENGAYWGYSNINYRRSKKNLKVDLVSHAVKDVLRENGINPSCFMKDWAFAGEFCKDALIIDLAVIYLARNFITQKKKEFIVGCSWQFYGEVKVYAENEDDAIEKAEFAPIPHYDNLEYEYGSFDVYSISGTSEE